MNKVPTGAASNLNLIDCHVVGYYGFSAMQSLESPFNSKEAENVLNYV